MGFLKVITKSRIVGLLTVLIVGFFVLRTGDEPSDAGDRDADLAPATDRQLQPKEPTFLTPIRDYGIAHQPSAADAPSPYGNLETYRKQSYPEIDSDGYRAPAPYGRTAQTTADGFRFRPLSEQEQRRVRESYPDKYLGRYGAPYISSPQVDPSVERQSPPGARAPFSSPGAYPDSRQESYSFRPLEKSPGARGRWQGPYQEPGQRYDSYPMDPWSSPRNPQWGSTPPPHRMYPNRYQDSGRWLSAR